MIEKIWIISLVLVILSMGVSVGNVFAANYSYSYEYEEDKETISQKDQRDQDWTVQWWKWVLAHSYQDLLLDSTGSNIMKDQPNNDQVFFLTGAYNSEQIRNVTVEAGKYILSPVLNGIYSCMDCNIMDVFNMRDRLVDAGHIDDAIQLEARFDDKLLPYTRITSDIFDVAYRNDSAYIIASQDVGKLVPSISDGYWVVLEPEQLIVGNHTFYTNAVTSGGYSTQVRYNIQVVDST